MAKLQLKKAIGDISTMSHPQLVNLLRSLDCNFDLDFTDEFLNSLSLERLRHITTAAALHARPRRA